LNLDGYPHPDFSFKDHFLVRAGAGQESVIEVTPKNYPEAQKKYPDLDGVRRLVPYKTISARGCPFSCTYCSIGSLDRTVMPYRKITVPRIIDELEQVIAAHGDIIDVISFSDDTFLTHSDQWILEFCETYKARINYPFRVLGHPLSVRQKQLDLLCQAGCMHFGMGIESLSQRILFDVYDRKTPVPKVIEAANRLVQTSKKHKILPPTFDVILGNPYETAADTHETFRMLAKVDRPAAYTQYAICFFPGSKLFNRAADDGIIDPQDPVHYRSWYSNEWEIAGYLRVLYELKFKKDCLSPGWLGLLSSRPAFRIFRLVLGQSQWPYNLYQRLGYKTEDERNPLVLAVWAAARWLRASLRFIRRS